MEDFFTPTRRLQDQHDYISDDLLGFTEVQLAVSVEAFLSHRWNWSDLYNFAAGDEDETWKVLWITEDTMIWVEAESTRMDFELLEDQWRATFTATTGETQELVIGKNVESESLSAKASSVFWHAVTTSNCVKLRLKDWSSWSGLCSGPALSRVLEASPSLELLEFELFAFEEAHCRVFPTLERTGLEVTFEDCSFDAHGAKDTFIEWLRHSQVVTKLEYCTMERIMYSALTGNSSVKISQLAHSLMIKAALTFGPWPWHSQARRVLKIYACH